jgi:hypothetical protein
LAFIPDHPPSLKEIVHWWNTPKFTLTLIIHGKRLVILYCHHFPDRRPVYPYLGIVADSCWNSQNLCAGNMMQRAAAKKLAKFPCGVRGLPLVLHAS